MSIDWSKTYKGAMRGSRGKFGSYAEMLQVQHAKSEEVKKSQEAFRQLEPLLRKSLLDHMVHHRPITVVAPFQYITEELHKSEWGSASFNLVNKDVPVGTQLTFSHWDKTMGQWIFKSQSGDEIEIYDTPQVQVPGGIGGTRMVPNPGFYGLLTRTNIYQTVTQALESEE